MGEKLIIDPLGSYVIAITDDCRTDSWPYKPKTAQVREGLNDYLRWTRALTSLERLPADAVIAALTGRISQITDEDLQYLIDNLPILRIQP